MLFASTKSVKQIPYRAFKSGFENDRSDGENVESRLVLDWQTADEHEGLLGSDVPEVCHLARRRFNVRDSVHSQDSPLIVLSHLHRVPPRIVEVLPRQHGHSALPEVGAELHAAPDQFQLQEVNASIVQVHEKGIRLPSHEVEAEGAVKTRLPGRELCIGLVCAIQLEGVAPLQKSPEQEALQHVQRA